MASTAVKKKMSAVPKTIKIAEDKIVLNEQIRDHSICKY